MDQTQIILRQLLMSSPVLLVCIVGLVLGCGRIQQHSRPAFWLIVGCTLLLFQTLAGPLVFSAFARRVAMDGNNMAARVKVMYAFEIAYALVRGAAIASLIAAALVGRHDYGSDTERRNWE